MKKQNYAKAKIHIPVVLLRPEDLLRFGWFCSIVQEALNDYKLSRENGNQYDAPQTPFPSAGFDTLDIANCEWLSSSKWPDKKGRYWWKIHLGNGRVVKDFYWTKDETRGWSDIRNVFSFNIHHEPTSITLSGFSSQPDYVKGFPDESGSYWRCIEYQECGAIKTWMIDKDRNYLARLEREKQANTSGAPLQKNDYQYNHPPLQQPIFHTRQGFEPIQNDSFQMKTQNVGETSVRDPSSPGVAVSRLFLYLFRCGSMPCVALKNYRENRENGTAQDNPKYSFPSAGFDALDIKSGDKKSSSDWPDSQGCYWWKITLNDGRVIEDFYWTEDKVRGFPDKSNKNRYWFIVRHKNGTKIEGFSEEPNYEKGFPDKNEDYWYTIRFTDTYCPAIRQWVEEKDRNYLARYDGFQMKTQSFGRSISTANTWGGPYGSWVTPSVTCRTCIDLSVGLKNYRENRENGVATDNPKTSFPSEGFDALDIKNSNYQSSEKWPDKQGRYWWKLTLEDGQVVNDFYWTEDKVRGFPEKNKKTRYWFIVHHAPSGTKVEGFSQEPDYDKGFPDEHRNYWYYIQYTECGAIKEWMEEKDKNYLTRMKQEKAANAQASQRIEEGKKQKEKEKLKTPLYAVLSKDIEALKEFANDKNTCWREVDEYGNNVFHLAAIKSSIRLLSSLLEAVPHSLQRKLLQQSNDNDDTPLHMAAKQGKVEIIKALLNALGSVIQKALNDINLAGLMPLHVAAQQGKLEAVQVLINAGANRNALTKDNKTAQMLAQEQGHVMLSQLLKTLSAKDDPLPLAIPSFRLPRENSEEDVDNQRQATFSSASSSSGSFHRGESSSGFSRARLKTLAQERARESEGSTPMGIDEQGVGRVNLVIPKETVTKGRLIRIGGFGAVYEGTRYGERVAIKELLEQNLTREVKDAFFKEAGIMMQLRHGNIVQLYGILLKPYSMVMEYMKGGALDGLLRSEAPLSWQLCYKISLDVAQGLAFLHDQRIVHRDLKSLNVLLDEHYIAKLSDFGLSKVKNSSSQNYGAKAGTIQWIAPELLDDETREFTKACDVYSYGMLLWEIVSRDMPYKHIGNRALVPLYVMRGKRETLPADAPTLLSTLTTRCWAQEAKERPRIEEVVQTLMDNPITDNVARPSPHAQKSTETSASVSGGGYLPSQQPSGEVVDGARFRESDRALSTGSTPSGNAKSPLYAKALYAFHGKETNQLSFEKGAILKVLKRTTDKWWVCEYAGQRGYAPSNYLMLAKENASLSEGQPSGYARSYFHSPPTHNERSSAFEKEKTPSVPDAASLPSSFERGYF